MIAYNAPISGCTEEDFSTDKVCTDSCINGIQRTISNLMSACQFVEPVEDSVLDLAISGRLLDALCPNNDEDNDQKTSVTTILTSVSRTSTTTPVSTSSTSATRSTSTSALSSTPFEADPPQTETTAPATTSTLTNTRINEAPTATPNIGVEPEETEDGNDNPLAAGGGGSPFDPIQFSSTSGTRNLITSAICFGTFLAGASVFAIA